jgi:hypothetical protein
MAQAMIRGAFSFGRVSVAIVIALGASAALGRTRAEVLQQQKQQAMDAIAAKPLLEKHSIEEVFAIERSGDDLALRTFLQPVRYYEERRAELTGLAFPAVVQCREMSRDIPEVEFEFTLDDWSDPSTHAQLHIQSRPPEVQIEKTWYTPAGERAVLLMQGSQATMLRLSSHEGPGPETLVQFREPNFATLHRKHRQTVEQYLRPLLRDVKQEAVFAPEKNEAWQVLADDLPVDESYRTPVMAHLADLNDPSYAVRSAATRGLYDLGRGAAVYLLHVDREKLTDEQKLRVDQVVSRYSAVPEEQAAKLHDDSGFLIDCLYCEDLQLRQLALRRLTKVTGKDVAFDLTVKDQAQVNAVNALRQQLFPAPTAAKPVTPSQHAISK